MRAAVLCLVLALAVASRAEEDPTVKLAGVKDLDPTNFDTIVNGGKGAFLEFFAPWCGHCKHLTPEYKKLGELVAADPTLNSQVVIAKVDADAHRELGERFAVQGFPTIKWLPRGRTAASDAIDYNGARTAEAMADWIRKRLEKDQAFARIPEIAEIAVKFMEGEIHGEEAIKQAEAVTVEDSQKDNAALYIRYLKKVEEKGTEYVAKEVERLKKISEGGKMSPTKLMEVSRKISVLSSFDKNAPAVVDDEPTDEPGYDDMPDFGEMADFDDEGMDLGDVVDL